MKSLKSVVVGALAAVVVFSGIQVVSAVTTNKVIKACANKKTGVMRYTTKSCNKKLETTLVFNSQGVQGVQGVVGVNGTAGAKGDTGTAGAKGDTGTAGASGANVNSQVKNICGSNGTTACAVGVQGPGGGIVFMTPATLGNTSGLFYEAAPSTWYQPSGDPQSDWCSNTTALLGNIVGATSGAMNGATKSAIMLDNCGSGAASLVDAYTATVSGVVYADWFLPSKGELNQMYNNRLAIGGFVSGNYWSSSETNATGAWVQVFTNGDRAGINKTDSYRVRPVRAF